MPLNTKAKSQPGGMGFHDVLHKVFLDTRKDMHLASKAEGMAEYLLEERVKARTKANLSFINLTRAAKEGELSASLLKDLSNAETRFHNQDTLLKEADAKFGAAKQKYTSKSALFQRAKTNCEQAGCPQFHGARNEIPEPSKEEQMAQKKTEEEQERQYYQKSQARTADKERKDSAEKEEGRKGWAASWKQTREKYEKSQEPKKRRRDEYEKENPPSQSQKGSKPWSEDKDEPPSKRNYQDAPPREGPDSKKPRPTRQATSPAVKPVAKPLARYQEWLSTVEEGFKDYTTISSFPEPPSSTCSKPSCKSDTRVLAACACDIRRCLNHLTASQLKDLRVLFHPDKFSKCREDLVESFKRKANAMFVVINAMYGEKK